jgi:hypothetical protein
MTTVIVPDFIVGLFQTEISIIILQVLNTVSDKFSIPLHELKHAVEFEDKSINIISEDTEQIRITRRKAKKVLDPDARCQGIVKKDGVIKQCSFCHNTTSKYCTRHENKVKCNPNFFDKFEKEKMQSKSDEKKLRKMIKVY